MVLVAWEQTKLSPESVTAALRSLLAGDREAARAAGDGVPAAAGGGQGAGRGPVLHGLPVLPAQGRLPAAQLMPPQALAAPGRLLVAPDSPAQAAATWVPGWFADGFAAGLLSQRPSVLSGKPWRPLARKDRLPGRSVRLLTGRPVPPPRVYRAADTLAPSSVLHT